MIRRFFKRLFCLHPFNVVVPKNEVELATVDVWKKMYQCKRCGRRKAYDDEHSLVDCFWNW